MYRTMANETTLVGERLTQASKAYHEYAKSVKDDPMCMAFFEGAQWADQNPIPRTVKEAEVVADIEGYTQHMIDKRSVDLFSVGYHACLLYLKVRMTDIAPESEEDEE